MNRLQRVLCWGCCLGVLTLTTSAWSQEDSTDEKPEDVDFLIKAMWNPEARVRQQASDLLAGLEEKPWDKVVSVLATEPQFPAATAAILLEKMKKKLKSPEDPIPAKTQAALYDILSNPATEPWRWNLTAILIRRIAPDSLKNHVELWTWGVNHPAPIIQLPSLLALQGAEKAGQPAQYAVVGLLKKRRFPLTSLVLSPQIVTDQYIGLEQSIPAYDPLIILTTLVKIEADPNLMVGPLTRLTHHVSEYVRLDAAAMLGKLKVEQLPADPRPYAARVLADLATLPWGKVRVAAVIELGKVGKPATEMLPVLVKLLNERDDDIRVEAATAIGKLGINARSAKDDLKKPLRYAKLDREKAVEAVTAAIKAIDDAIAKEKAEQEKAEKEQMEKEKAAQDKAEKEKLENEKKAKEKEKMMT